MNKRQTRIPSARTPASKEKNEDQQIKEKQRPTKPKGVNKVTKPPGQTKASLKRQELALSKRLEHTRFVCVDSNMIIYHYDKMILTMGILYTVWIPACKGKYNFINITFNRENLSKRM